MSHYQQGEQQPLNRKAGMIVFGNSNSLNLPCVTPHGRKVSRRLSSHLKIKRYKVVTYVFSLQECDHRDGRATLVVSFILCHLFCHITLLCHPLPKSIFIPTRAPTSLPHEFQSETLVERSQNGQHVIVFIPRHDESNIIYTINNIP